MEKNVLRISVVIGLSILFGFMNFGVAVKLLDYSGSLPTSSDPTFVTEIIAYGYDVSVGSGGLLFSGTLETVSLIVVIITLCCKPKWFKPAIGVFCGLMIMNVFGTFAYFTEYLTEKANYEVAGVIDWSEISFRFGISFYLQIVLVISSIVLLVLAPKLLDENE